MRTGHRAALVFRRPGLAEFASYLAWTVVGILAAVGVAGILTIGIFAIGLATAAAAALLKYGHHGGRSLFGLGLGAAVLACYLGWLNRGGPGTVCRPTADLGQSCADQWSPWPFVVMALALGGVSLAGLLLAIRRSGE